MPISPIITFKAGQCEAQTLERPAKIKPQEQAGYIYLYSEDDLVHFCWRKRSDPLDEPELDLVMVPTDGSFVPYEYDAEHPTSKTNGRIFVLKFASSSQRHLFWLQSKPQSRNGDPSWFSPRDRKIGDIVHRLLQGEEVNVTRELTAVRNVDDRRDDDDEPMEDVEGTRGPHTHRGGGRGGGGGGAGPDATGGDIREEGEGPREGGADGARAWLHCNVKKIHYVAQTGRQMRDPSYLGRRKKPIDVTTASASAPDAAAAVRNFLESLQRQPRHSGGQQQQQQQQADLPYPSLDHLLPPSVTVAMVEAASSDLADSLLGCLPPAVMVLASGVSELDGQAEPAAEAVEDAKACMSLEDKKSLLKRVLRSPQFYQALGSLTMALRDGGLPGIADALGVRVENGGYIPSSEVPLGGGHAVKAFVEGVKRTVEDEP